MAVYVDEEGVSFETTKRAISECPAMRVDKLADGDLFEGDASVNSKALLDFFRHEGRLTEAQVSRILSLALDLLGEEPNLLTLLVPIVICGDIHGQFFDLCKLFDVSGGPPPETKYLFVGDYVDRGYFSIECLVYLLALKVNFPQHVFLLRGNHECRHLTKHFTFKLECEYKYTSAVYDLCMQVCDALPIAAVVNRQLFCVHGGISPDLKRPGDVNKFNRFQDPPTSGLMCDLLWSDPTENFGDDNHLGNFTHNRSRGCSYRFSLTAAEAFLNRNDLLAIVRGHEAQSAGYRLYAKGKANDFPALITIFSAPNYVDVYNNQAAVLKYDGETLNIRQFNCEPHPFHLPKFINALEWSLPFVGEKLAELLMAILELPTLNADIVGLTVEEAQKLHTEEQQQIVVEKLEALEEVGAAFAEQRSEIEALSEFGLPSGEIVTLPPNELCIAEEEIKAEIENFKTAKQVDRTNEMLPGDDETESVGSEGATVEYPPPEIVSILELAKSPSPVPPSSPPSFVDGAKQPTNQVSTIDKASRI